VQAQDFPAAKWALGLRMPDGVTDALIERAFNDGRILRTHVMRPTWHFVAAEDIHWMLELTAPRVHRALAWGNRQFGLDAAMFTRAATLFERALSGGRALTRSELGACLARAGLAVKGTPLALMTIYAEQERVICSGPMRGRQQTYALLSTRVARPRRLSRDEALAELSRRYFSSHGPATIRDFVWWSGLTTADARRGLEICGGRPQGRDGYTYWTLGTPREAARGGAVHLLPIYDEYLVAYRDLHAVPRRGGSFGRLEQAVISRGHITGTWKAARTSDGLRLDIVLQRTPTAGERRALARIASRYGRFLETPVSVSIA
jgi:hypothetical protein